jgi:hypothetical protein
MTAKAEFDQLCQIIQTKLESHIYIEYCLHHITNQNTITIDRIKVRRSLDKNNYIVTFSKDHDEGLLSEYDQTTPNYEPEEDLLSAWGTHTNLNQAIFLAFEEANHWDQCQDCNTFCEQSWIPHKCTSCVIANGIVQNLPDHQKFECTICNTFKFISQRKTLTCEHFFCQSCIKKFQQPTCPHCRQPIT